MGSKEAGIAKEKVSLVDTLKSGVILYSSITKIFYKVEKGKLYKYPDYAGAQRGWTESDYTGEKKACMKPATAKELEGVR